MTPPQESREVRGVRFIQDVLADVRYALRGLRQSPAFATAAIVTLALGIGANTAIFSVVNAVILKPLPFPHPEQLVMLGEDNPEKNWTKQFVAPANYLDWKERIPAFADVMAYTMGGGRTLTGVGDPVLIQGSFVAGNFFSVLGVNALRGRTLREEETWGGQPRTVVVSERFWRTRLGGDPKVVGRTIQVDGSATEIVGVMPASFGFPRPDLDLWFPLGWDQSARTQRWFRQAHWLRAVGRLKPGVTPSDADRQLQTVVRQLQLEFPATNRVMGADLTPLQEFLVGKLQRPLLVLLGSVAVLLLIACANVGNLLLVRSLGREREAALRLALGAGRGRLVQQAITESLVLSAVGGVFGVALGWAGTRALAALQPNNLLPVRDVGVDWRLVAFVVAVTVLSGLIFGIAPALWRAHRLPSEVLKEGGRLGTAGGGMRRVGNALVMAEVALALLLGTGAGLLVRSFWRLERVNPGFDPSGVLAVGMNLPNARYDSAAKIVNFYQALEERARALPGVTSGAAVLSPPLGGTGWTSDYHIGGRPADQYGSEVGNRIVSPDYFRVMRVPLVAGRLFTEADRVGAPHVVLINDALARREFPDESAIGQRIAFDKIPDSTSTWYTIVGVVGDEHQLSLAEDPVIEAFYPLGQRSNSYMNLVVRTAGDPTTLEPAVRRLVADLDPNLAISQVRTMQQMFRGSMATQRFFMLLLLTFSVVGLVLSLVGVYGVVAQVAGRRTREMGIRLALGAQATEIQWLVVRYGLWLVGGGLGVGALVAVGSTRAMRSLLFEVQPTDPTTFGVVAAVLALAALAATWLPARRVSKADPARTLREE